MHLTILYCQSIWTNAHYYALVWVEQIIFAWMEQQRLIISICFSVSVTRNYTSFSLDPALKWSEMTEHLKRYTTPQTIYRINHICHKLNILSLCNIIYCRDLISCKAALQRLYLKKRYTHNLEFNMNIHFLAFINIIQYLLNLNKY